MWRFLNRTKHYTAEDVHADVLARTLVVLERIKMNMEKATLPIEIKREEIFLKELGLINSKNMQVIKDAKAKIDVHNAIIEENTKIIKIMEEMYKAFGDNTFYIPMKDFTTILDKYNLAVGRLEDYKGTIPETNLKEIAKAKQILWDLQCDKRITHYNKPIVRNKLSNQKYYYEQGVLRTRIIEVEEPGYEETYMSRLYPTLFTNIGYWYRLSAVVSGHANLDRFKRFPMIKPNEQEWYYRTDGLKQSMLIAAPVQEMNTLYEVKERIITEDPIVFSTIGNGVIIYSMWGNEGNDEVLKKYQQLNKFISEHVNLGITNESQKSLS